MHALLGVPVLLLLGWLVLCFIMKVVQTLHCLLFPGLLQDMAFGYHVGISLKLPPRTWVGID